MECHQVNQQKNYGVIEGGEENVVKNYLKKKITVKKISNLIKQVNL